MKWRALAEADDTIFRDAPIVATVTTHLPVAPERLWDALAADDAVVSWSPLVTASEWSGERGVGVVRTVTIAGFLVVREVFSRWNEPNRMTFTADSIIEPGLVRAFAEDYRVTAEPGGASLEWTVAVDTAVRSRLVSGLARIALRAAVGRLAAGLNRKIADS